MDIMSDKTRDNLMERAEEMINYFEGKLPAQLIEQDLENNDMQNLHYHVCAAEGVAAQQEMNAEDVF